MISGFGWIDQSGALIKTAYLTGQEASNYFTQPFTLTIHAILQASHSESLM
jgi:hypothetical protein